MKATPSGQWSALVERAAKGWTADAPDIAQGIVNLFRDKLRGDVETIEAGDSFMAFVISVPSIRLRGMNDMACLLIAGIEQRIDRGIRRFWQLVSGPEQLVTVLALTPAAVSASAEAIPKGFACTLDSSALVALFGSPEPSRTFADHIRAAIPPRRLNPYDTKHAVYGNMFYGRRNEIEQLLEAHTTNFAIAGQGRVGKTSLVAEYRMRTKTGADRRARRFSIDFYACQPKSESAITQFLAKQIDGGTNRSAHLTLDDLEGFLRFHAHRLDGALELLLDEVDMVCRSLTFRLLAHLSKQRHGPIARLILVGRGELLREALDERSPLKNHVTLLRLEPLDHRSSMRLLKEPCADMGVRFANDSLVERIVYLTGGLPQLLQYMGERLVTMAFADATDVISTELLERVWQDFETTEIMISSFRDLENPKVKLMAALLIENSPSEIDEYTLVDLAAHADVSLGVLEARNICHELLLANLLAWTRSGYRIANGTLAERLRDTGTLRRARETTLAVVRAGATR